MKKQQWITAASALVVLVGLYFFAPVKPSKSKTSNNISAGHSDDDGHDHGTPSAVAEITIDSILHIGKTTLTPAQVQYVESLERSVSATDNAKTTAAYHELSHFWKDSARIFELYGWYEAQSARLENSEKNLTFAAHLFLENLQQEPDMQLARWKALQAKDLFERSLKLNPNNDSSKIGLGACYLFGNISPMPMEGINKIREVVDKDSTNVFGQMMLARGSLLSNQIDKAIPRLLTVLRVDSENVEAMLILADAYERHRENEPAIHWYQTAQKKIPMPQIKEEIQKRINELSKK